MLGVPSSGEDVKGLLPGRGPGAAAGRGGIGVSCAGAGMLAAGASTSGAVSAGAAFAAAFLAGAFLAGAAAADSGFAGKASRTLRATGGSIVDDALFTNSPLSFNHPRRALLSRPSSFASS
jgi:hypothetical protein